MTISKILFCAVAFAAAAFPLSAFADDTVFMMGSGSHMDVWLRPTLPAAAGAATEPDTEQAPQQVANTSWDVTVKPAKGRPPHRLGAPAPVVMMHDLNGTKHALKGIASYYKQDQMTATGERFNRRDMTAAHPTLPFGTRVKVTNERSGNSVIVRINDRGPFTPGRVIDLSEAAAEQIGLVSAGLARVSIEPVP